MEMLATLITWALCGYISYKIAKNKNRDANIWAALGVLFGLIAVLIIVFLPTKEDKNLNE